MRIFIGNISWDCNDDELGSHFGEYGEVTASQIIIDRETGRSRGFGFVTMPHSAEAMAAIEALSGREFMGRALHVSEATEKPRRDVVQRHQ